MRKNLRQLSSLPRGLLLFQSHRTIHRKKPIVVSNDVTLQHTRLFHSRKRLIDKTILGTIGPSEIIYGEQSLKARFPRYLQRYTQDYDIYSPHPRKDAVQAEKALDHRFRGNFFYVKKAQHLGTYKVVAYANSEGYADFSKKPNHVPYDKINGKNYVKLSVEKEHRIHSLKDPSFEWRHGKDRDALNRIKIYERGK